MSSRDRSLAPIIGNTYSKEYVLHLSYVGIKCTKCEHDDFITSCEFSHKLSLPLTDHTAAYIPKRLGCKNCQSKDIFVKFPNPDQLIVDQLNLRWCEYCDGAIPHIFRISFPEANFCPQCVKENKISDEQIVLSTGELFEAEAFWKMSIQFKGRNRDKWLRKAADSSHALSCFRLADILIKGSNIENREEAAKYYELGLSLENSSENTRNAEYQLGTLHIDNLIKNADLDHGLQLLNRSMMNGAAYAAEKLGLIYFLGQNNIQIDKEKAFSLFKSALDKNPEFTHLNAYLGLFYLYGDGCDTDETLAEQHLSFSLERYAKNNSQFNIIKAREQLSQFIETRSLNFPLSKDFRKFIAILARKSSPYHDIFAGELEKYAENTSAKSELYVLRTLPREVKRPSYNVQDMTFKSSNHNGTIGQIEEIEKNIWIGVTHEGEKLQGSYKSEKEIVEALANKVGSNAIYVDFIEKMKRLQKQK